MNFMEHQSILSSTLFKSAEGVSWEVCQYSLHAMSAHGRKMMFLFLSCSHFLCLETIV